MPVALIGGETEHRQQARALLDRAQGARGEVLAVLEQVHAHGGDPLGRSPIPGDGAMLGPGGGPVHAAEGGPGAEPGGQDDGRLRSGGGHPGLLDLVGIVREGGEAGRQVRRTAERGRIDQVVETGHEDHAGRAPGRDARALPQEQGLGRPQDVMVDTTLGAGPLAGPGVELIGDQVPHPLPQPLGVLTGLRIIAVAEDALQFLEEDGGVARAVVLRHPAVGLAGGPLGGDASTAIGHQVRIQKEPTGPEADRRPHGADIGVVRTDVALDDGRRGVAQGRTDPLGLARGEAGFVEGEDVDETDPDEVGPVPVRRGHGGGRFLGEPPPQAVVGRGRVRDLQGQQTVEDGAGTFQVLWLAAGQQQQDIIGVVFSPVDHLVLGQAGMVPRTPGPAADQARRRIEARIPIPQGLLQQAGGRGRRRR